MVTLSTTKPKVNDPYSLRHMPRWVIWCEEKRERANGTTYKTKIPYDPNADRQAKIPTDPSTWGTRAEAERRWERLKKAGRKRGGIGLVLGDLGDGTHLLGIDLDGCLTENPDDYSIEPFADEILTRFDTYTEVSPSAKGMKLFFRLKSEDMPAVQRLIGFDDGKPKLRLQFNVGKHLELALDSGRYYTVTGSVLAGLHRFRTVSLEDIRWLAEEAGPAFLAHYGTAAPSGDGQQRQGRDESGSGYGYRFFGDCKARGLDYEDAWSAIQNDQTPAGEWARRTSERELKRTYLRAKPARLKNSSLITESRPLVSRSVNLFKRRKIKWLWYPFIPRGMLTQFFGDGEVGKSTAALDIAARISKGEPWPRFEVQDEAERAPKGSVIILCKEDDTARIIRPRLEAAGADLNKIHIVGYDVPDDAEDFDPLDRLDTTAKDLERQIEQIGDVVLVLIDPITDYVGDIDMYKDDQVRKLLSPIARMCARRDVVGLFILHLNKKTDQAARHRAMGSMAFRNVSKSSVLFAHDQSHPGRRLMAMEKKNLTKDKWTVAFTLRSVPGNPYPKVVWDRELQDIDVDEILNKPTKQQRSVRLLRGWLADGPKLQRVIQNLAQEQEISEATLRLAKEKVGVVSRKGLKGWIWELPSR
jgi:putative DNA primase/helicase